jgi:hypothetical protein
MLLAKVGDEPRKLGVTFLQVPSYRLCELTYGRRKIPMQPRKISFTLSSGRGIVGPIFFENTINSERYMGSEERISEA